MLVKTSKDDNSVTQGIYELNDSCDDGVHVQLAYATGLIQELAEECRSVQTSSGVSGGLWITYDGEYLKVSHDATTASSRPAPIINTPVDLTTFFDSSEPVYIGFTSGTYWEGNNHEVWAFSFYQDLPTLSPSELPSPEPPAHVTEIDYSTGFCQLDPSSSFQLNGNTLPDSPSYLTSENCALRLTDVENSYQAASAFLPISITNNFVFSAFIEYRIPSTAPDGMTFVMHQDPLGEFAYGSYGAFQGVYEDAYDETGNGRPGIKPALVVEMDKCKSAEII